MFRHFRPTDADRWTVGFVVVLLAGSFLRLYRLGDESLWLDEIYSVLDVTTRTSGELLFMPFIKLHLPLYYLVLHYWVELFGLSEASVRAPSALFGIAAVAVIYLVGAQLYDRQVGLLSAALLAFSQYHVYYAQEARMYSLLVLLTTLSFYWLLRVADGGSRRDAAGYLITTTLLAYTHPFSLFVVLTQNLYVVTAPLLGRDDSVTIPLRRWVGLQAVVGALIAPWVLYAVYEVLFHDGSPSWISEPTLAGLLELPVEYLGWGASPRELLVGEGTLTAVRALLALLIVGCVLVGSSNRSLVRSSATNRLPTLKRRDGSGTHHRAYLLALWATVPILVPAALSFALDPMLSVRYTIPASIGLFVLVANGVRNLRYAHLNVVVAVVLVTLLLFPFVGHYAVDHRPQWDEATDHVDANAEPDDLVLVHNSPLTRTPFLYYLDRDDVTTAVVADRPGDDQLRSAVADEGTVWVVVQPSDGDNILETVEETHERVDHRSYYDVDVYRYEPSDDRAAR